ncbi:hypothetical protein APT96_15100 [Proteus mirabilis]|nr:hypothetical protein APT96_15100 [Proteus mirabilis]
MLLLLALVIVMIGSIIKFKSCKEILSNIIMHNQILKKLPQIEQTHQRIVTMMYVAFLYGLGMHIFQLINLKKHLSG